MCHHVSYVEMLSAFKDACVLQQTFFSNVTQRTINTSITCIISTSGDNHLLAFAMRALKGFSQVYILIA